MKVNEKKKSAAITDVFIPTHILMALMFVTMCSITSAKIKDKYIYKRDV